MPVQNGHDLRRFSLFAVHNITQRDSTKKLTQFLPWTFQARARGEDITSTSCFPLTYHGSPL